MVKDSNREKKYNVILDLDETLVSSHGVSNFPFDKPDIRNKILNYTFHNMESYYIIFERPHLQDFLKFLFKNFNVSVWSAGSKDYVAFIVNNVILKPDPTRKLDYLLWSYHCKDSNKKHKNKKCLKILWDDYKLDEFTKKNTVLVDDMKETCQPQKKNCINVPVFDILETKKDSYLKELRNKLKNIQKNGL